jgi:hypothetical protein
MWVVVYTHIRQHSHHEACILGPVVQGISQILGPSLILTDQEYEFSAWIKVRNSKNCLDRVIATPVVAAD